MSEAELAEQPGVWMPPTVRADLLSWALAALWGGGPAAVKLSLEHAHPLRLAMLRLIVAWATMLAVELFANVNLRPRREEWVPLLALGVLFAGHTAAAYYGHHHTSVGHAAVLIGSNPIWAMLLAHFFIPGDRLTPRSVAGMLIVYGGLMVLFSQHLSGEGETLTGDLLMVTASLTIAIRQVWVARMTQRVNPVKVVFWETLVATPFFIVAAQLIETDAWVWHWELLIALGYQGVLMFGIGLILNTQLLQKYLPSRILATQMTIPMFGVIFGWIIFNEPVGWELATGVALLTLGTAVSPRRPFPEGMPAHVLHRAEEAVHRHRHPEEEEAAD